MVDFPVIWSLAFAAQVAVDVALLIVNSSAAPRGCSGPDRTPVRRGVPIHRAAGPWRRPGTGRTAHPRPPRPSAAPSTRRRNTSGTRLPRAGWRHCRPVQVAVGCGRQPAPSIITRPARHLHYLIQNLTLVLLRAFTYALAYLVVISARDDIDNPLPMPDESHHFAGIFT